MWLVLAFLSAGFAGFAEGAAGRRVAADFGA